MNFKKGIKRGFWIFLTSLSSLIRDDDGKSKLFLEIVQSKLILCRSSHVITEALGLNF